MLAIRLAELLSGVCGPIQLAWTSAIGHVIGLYASLVTTQIDSRKSLAGERHPAGSKCSRLAGFGPSRPQG